MSLPHVCIESLKMVREAIDRILATYTTSEAEDIPEREVISIRLGQIHPNATETITMMWVDGCDDHYGTVAFRLE